MRVLSALIVLALGMASVDMIAAGRGQTASTATLSGTASDSGGHALAITGVQVRDVSTGQLAGTATTDSAGLFSFVGLPAGTYTVEIVNTAGQIVGTSGSVVLSAGAAVTGVNATAPETAPATSGTFFSRHAVIILGAAGAAGVAGGIAAASGGTASPSN